MNTRLLRKVKKHILEEPKRLMMEDWARGVRKSKHAPACGTVACIAGWALVLSQPEPEMFLGNGKKARAALGELLFGPLYEWKDPSTSAEEELGITTSQGDRLFMVENWPKIFKEEFWEANPVERAKIAARRIEHFIKTKK